MGAVRIIKPVKKGSSERNTKVMRVPLELVKQVESYVENKGYRIPRLSGKIPAGFPLDTEAHVEEWVDINQMLITHPKDTFIIEAVGNSMTGAGIEEGDLLIVDGGIEPKNDMIVIAAIDGEYTIKRLSHKDNKIKLIPENTEFPEIDITENMQFYIAGVVVHMLREFKH